MNTKYLFKLTQLFPATKPPETMTLFHYIIFTILIIETASNTELYSSLFDNTDNITTNIGETPFNNLVKIQRPLIIRKQCPNCDNNWKDIYYRRLQNYNNINYYNLLLQTWTNINNTMSVDFNLYSNLNDSLTDSNPWIFCNFNDNNTIIGAFYNCGPNGPGSNQWFSKTDPMSKNAKFTLFTGIMIY